MSNTFSSAQLGQIFSDLKTFSATKQALGTTRLAYSSEDEQAHQYLIEKMQQLGLKVRQDAMGNVFARLSGWDSSLPAVGTGSHIDTVPLGGNYDGVVGVLSGIYALNQFKRGQLKRDLEVIIFRAEESSRFSFSCAGSKALTGKMDKNRWLQNKDKDNLTIFQAIDDAGYKYDNVTSDEFILTSDYFSAFVEVHIEQGKCLESAEKPIGIVTGIAAPTRFCVNVNGQADHSGATPMNQRQDALVASAKIISDIHLAACNELAYGTVGTVGKLDVVPNSMNVIPGKVIFYVDIRGIDINSIKRVEQQLFDSINNVSTQTGMQIDICEISREQPVMMDQDICQVIENLCIKQNIPYQNMLSGAGHDTMNMASKYPCAMIFVPSKGGISHHVNEFSHFDDIELAANLLTETLAILANI